VLRLLIDTDGGIDDALALLYALASPDLSIEAITTVHGNVPLEQATRNVFEVLAIAGTMAPVSPGAALPLSAPAVHARDVHGDDGLSGWTVGRPAPPSRTYALSIGGLARCQPGEITLVTLGPLTNLALALRSDPEGCRLLRRVVVMGGAVWVPGNITPAAEFNLFCDPQAARQVLHSGIPLMLIGLDVTQRVMLTQAALAEWLAGRDDPRARFLRAVSRHLFAFYGKRTGISMCYLHDPLAMGVAIDPSLVATRRLPLEIGPAGEILPGQVLVDVAAAVDSARFLEPFHSRVVDGNATPVSSV